MTTLIGLIIISCFFASCLVFVAGVLFIRSKYGKINALLGAIGIVIFTLNMLTWHLR